ncbi:hypothetical protein OU426_09375 [Frigidibacter sp. RF13]|uniref:hypothetical protein n=1 Tax=Frigidibacter sp. RF13 TaxID=2997340 RepID=UPI00226E545B|nr:hypothetical protein [Frigidibacter sp. RF13]MCY1127065.1 hypothetical protein [Frigidibacter sp. RF13]
MIRTIAALALSVLVALTGAGIAASRGVVQGSGQVLVFCSGGGLVQIEVDAEGNPTGRSHLCPDLAAHALAALDLAAADLPAPQALVVWRGFPMPEAAAALPLPAAFRARAPPVLSA